VTRLRAGQLKYSRSIPGVAIHPDRSTGPPSLIFNGHQGHFPGGKANRALSPPPRVEVKNTWSYTSSVPYVFMACTSRTLLLPIRSQHSRKVTQLLTPATRHVSEQTPHTSCIRRRLPDMHLTGESLARRLTTPLCQGRLTDQYTLAGGRSLGALLFYMSSPERTFETCPHRNSVPTPHSVLTIYFMSLGADTKTTNTNGNNQSPIIGHS
jgi:hypothetical protein